MHRCACWQNKPSRKLWSWLLRIIRYLKQTKTLGLVFDRRKFDERNVFRAACDAAFLSEQRSASRYGVLFFVAGALVHWTSSKPTRIVSSSTEAEIHGLVHTGKENVWEREFHAVLGYFDIQTPTLVFQDNKSAISLSEGGQQHKRSKHFGLEFDLFRQYCALGEIKIVYQPTEELVADLLTKPLPKAKFAYFRDQMMGELVLQQHFD